MNSSISEFQKDFPILSEKINEKPLIYFDNAATSQTPECVIESMADFYRTKNSNIHRGIHTLSEVATEKYENSRKKVASFINTNANNIIFTKNATESLNLVAHSYAIEHLKENDEILISYLEHHSNIIPWQEVCKKTGAILKYIDITKDGFIDLESFNNLICEKTKFISVTMMSNVTGVIQPLEKIISISKKKNIPVCLDACQAAAHMNINIKKLSCAFLAFSAHKICGPTGIGALYVQDQYKEKMKPFLTGGGTIHVVKKQKTDFADFPFCFEAGTPPIAEAIGFAKAIEYLEKIDMLKITKYEQELVKHATHKLSKIENLTIIGTHDEKQKGGIISFSIKNLHPHDIAAFLDQDGIAIRAGHHCAQPLMKKLKLKGTCRISFYFYNTKEEIDVFVESLKKTINMFL